MSLLQDPFTLLCCLISVILVGLSRGGFGGSMGMLGVPIMAFAIPPVQAAAILLPLLLLADIVGLWSWRKDYDIKTLKLLLPAACLGLAIGWLAAIYISQQTVVLIVGIMCIIFVGDYVRKKVFSSKHDTSENKLRPAKQNVWWGSFWGALSGISSFISHIGAPPYQVYVLPLRLSPTVLAGTTVRFFFIINVIKLAPYFALGQFDTTNLTTSFLLMPVIPIATLIGVWIVKRIKPEIFYPLMYVLMFLSGIKLIFDGININ